VSPGVRRRGRIVIGVRRGKVRWVGATTAPAS
jgi:hypothetical protein